MLTTRFYHHHGPAFWWESVRFLGKGWLVLGTIFYVNRTRQTRSVLKWRKSQRLAAIQDSTYYVRRHWLKKSSYCRSRCFCTSHAYSHAYIHTYSHALAGPGYVGASTFSWFDRRAVWPDLAKFRHFGKILKVFGQLLKALFTIWQNFVPSLTKILCYWEKLPPYKWSNIEK